MVLTWHLVGSQKSDAGYISKFYPTVAQKYGRIRQMCENVHCLDPIIFLVLVEYGGIIL